MADQTPNTSQQAAKPTTPAISTPSPAPGSGPTISSSASTSSSRPYVPQFSAATQLILQRLKAKDGKNDGSGSSFSSPVSSKMTTVVAGSSPTIKLEQDAFEDAKKRLVAGTGLRTSTSMSLKMPLVMPSTKMSSPSSTTTTTVKNLVLPSSISTIPRTGSSSSTTANLSLPLPPPPPPKHKSLTFKNNTTSAIKNINSGLTASGKVSVVKAPKPASSSSTITAAASTSGESKPKKAKTSTGNPVGRPSNASKAAAAAAALSAASDAATGHRKKRIKQQQQDIDEISSLSSLSDVSEREEVVTTPSGAAGAASALLTMTKSGRQVLKPTTYNPAAVDAANKKHRNTNSLPSHGGQYGSNKRTADQALCKKCTRMHSPASNPMVFCDGCNEGWHQRCHDPFIASEVIRDQTRSWICSICVAKREKHLSKKQQKLAAAAEQQQQQQQQMTRTGWADKPPQQRRAYLSTLPPQELVGLIMAALEVHPDLPIFPGPPAPSKNINNGKGQRSGPNGKSLKDIVLSREPSQEENGEDEEEYDPLAALWPKPGSGLYSLLPLNDADDDEYLVDSNDFEAFSSIVYDDRGRKVLENGLRV
ncbi:hypothetical protein B0T20DRAFT_375803 [Sordaria brevicollis]|uniref:PHD-type domain-containing protein n=1 Tax=Sordaria brevicollis TaxID=83679 RepID=A0AAE0PED8_SORBR|nr:hypothetical protein B0T20DRAFT_375803 [Sordaria brevicollis]